LPIQYRAIRAKCGSKPQLPRYVKDRPRAIGGNRALEPAKRRGGGASCCASKTGDLRADGAVRAGEEPLRRPIKLREPGFYEYAATIENVERRRPVEQNNTGSTTSTSKGRGACSRDGPQRDQRDWQSRPAPSARRSASSTFKGRTIFPAATLSMKPYDSIVSSTLAADCSTPSSSSRCTTASATWGRVPDGRRQNRFGPGGYHKTKVEDILPASMDVTKKKICPSPASWRSSCTPRVAEGTPGPNAYEDSDTRARRPGREVLARLSCPEDPAGHSTSSRRLRIRKRMVKHRNQRWLEPEGHARHSRPSMEDGLEGLSHAAMRPRSHMIIISDGDPQAPHPLRYIKQSRQPVLFGHRRLSIFPARRHG